MSEKEVTFVVTGFSSFFGVKANPTEQLVNWLLNGLGEGKIDLGQGVKVLSARVLRVAAEAVDEYLCSVGEELKDSCAPAAASAHADRDVRAGSHTPAPGTQVVLLHFGVHDLATHYCLESRAWNCADFRVPDENGWAPKEHELDAGLGTGFCLGTDLPLEALREQLERKGHRVAVSDDPGRFVCNWTYYRSCRLAQQHGWHALFVHVPPFTVCDETSQRGFLLDTLSAIAAQLGSAS